MGLDEGTRCRDSGSLRSCEKGPGSAAHTGSPLRRTETHVRNHVAPSIQDTEKSERFCFHTHV